MPVLRRLNVGLSAIRALPLFVLVVEFVGVLINYVIFRHVHNRLHGVGEVLHRVARLILVGVVAHLSIIPTTRKD